MEQDRDIEQVMMNITRTGGGIASLVVLSARLNLMLLTFLMRMAKKGLVAVGMADGFKGFVNQTKGEFTVYNIPVSAQQAESIRKLNALELQLETSSNPLEKTRLRQEMKALKAELPELQQLQKLGVTHYMLPKVNGGEHTMQVAVANQDQQLFKNWFLNHLTQSLSGGEKGMEELRAFTEGNYSIFNLPFEGAELEAALPDFQVLGLNYHMLPDLNVGDGNTQIAIPNADRSKLEVWFKMWKEKQLQMGNEVGEMYTIDENSYMSTGEMDQRDYVANSDPQFQAANQEFEQQAKEVPWNTPLGKENSEEFVKFVQDQNFEKITINKDSLVDNMQVSVAAREMQKEGYFISRVPGTYGENQQILLIPREQVFSADDGKTYIAFLAKNQNAQLISSDGKLHQQSFQETYTPYASVQRSFHNVQKIKDEASLSNSSGKSPVQNGKKNKFDNFKGREYNMGTLEKALLQAEPKL